MRQPLLFAAVLAFCGGLPQARAAISLTATNAYSTRTEGSYTHYAWPVRTTAAGKCLNVGATSFELYPATTVLLDPTAGAGTLLQFTISSSLTYTTTHYIRVQTTDATNPLDITLGTGAIYQAYTGGTATFSILLSSLCAQSGTADCQFDQTNDESASIGLNIGVHQSNSADFDSGQNGQDYNDYNTVQFDMVHCPTYTSTYNDTTDRESYSVAASPGDGKATVHIASAPTGTLSVGDFPWYSTILLFEESAAARTTPMTVAGATRVVEALGEPGAGSFEATDLTNDTTYNVQVGYVNVAGFVTPPGPPDGAAAAPQVTPSQIDGFLSENACFIASAAYGKENQPMIDVLRRFRGEVLMPYRWGRAFVQKYYRWSVQSSQWLEENGWAKPIVRALLLPITAIAAISTWVKTSPWAFLSLTGGCLAILFTLIYVGTRNKGRLGKGKRKP